ncbi:MAG: sugar ABC transporter permease [Opitutales bacterium]|nr:sugar ABC transporter permease [Opitutales bacterium]
MSSPLTRHFSPAWFFLLPTIVVMGTFLLYPVILAGVMAFQQSSGALAVEWIGWENFQFVLSDPDFYRAARNTLIFAAFSVFLQLPLSLGLAMLLNAKGDRTKGFFRLVIFSPFLVGPIFVGILFAVLFTPRFGMINRFLQYLTGWGLEVNWLSNPAFVLPAIILTALWMYVGFNMIYFLAALQSVSPDLMDAARVDGAGPWQRFLHVTVPAIKPVAVFVVIMSTIGSFQLFELPFALLQGTGGPDNAGLTLVMYLYNHAFIAGDLGLGAAVGWILAMAIFLISMVQIKVSKGGDHG